MNSAVGATHGRLYSKICAPAECGGCLFDRHLVAGSTMEDPVPRDRLRVADVRAVVYPDHTLIGTVMSVPPRCKTGWYDGVAR
jgi:hypothetical protein